MLQQAFPFTSISLLGSRRRGRIVIDAESYPHLLHYSAPSTHRSARGTEERVCRTTGPVSQTSDSVKGNRRPDLSQEPCVPRARGRRADQLRGLWSRILLISRFQMSQCGLYVPGLLSYLLMKLISWDSFRYLVRHNALRAEFRDIRKAPSSISYSWPFLACSGRDHNPPHM